MNISIEELRTIAKVYRFADNQRNLDDALRSLETALEQLSALGSATSPVGYRSDDDLKIYQYIIEARHHLLEAKKRIIEKRAKESSAFEPL